MLINDTEPKEQKRRWQYLVILLLLICLCAAAFAAARQVQGTGIGSTIEAPALTHTPNGDSPTATSTEMEDSTETGQPESGICLKPCDPENSICDDGLSCVKDNVGNYVCWGGIDSTGKYCGPTANQNCACKGSDYVCTLSNGQTTTNSNDPKCVTASEQPTCECKGSDYICTNSNGSITSASYNSVTCGGSGKCECRGPDLACPDGTYAQFNPICIGDGGTEPGCKLTLAKCNTAGYSDFDALTCTCYTS